MRHALNAFADRKTTEIVQDTLGALSLCITFGAVLFLPGLF
ncbi:hypothetical protein C8J27_106157 [Rhodobacter aestuarii]|uniref:Uncharacterized protein n=1 Tax=Rhodobacter aestuarii TaxID=453582 RepID=A0A1N7M6Z8_9RHOB|nr:MULTISPECIES: hypothetical protein [Rhodobacter]PTV94889.1 hypothetical protein C8J27_106157 [Rhodobacter aestuarii]SIS81854.1 hypothetical protein SAMN05421580_105157 [Rhodobacter aestuarii]SOC13942.1 hypothetical protein SAMN05877809_10742 [Rhodobacter sp. JA431]